MQSFNSRDPLRWSNTYAAGTTTSTEPSKRGIATSPYDQCWTGTATATRSGYGKTKVALTALSRAPLTLPHTRHLADPRRQTLQGRDNRRSVACKPPGPAAFCLGVLGVVAGTGRLVEVAPGEEVQ